MLTRQDNELSHEQALLRPWVSFCADTGFRALSRMSCRIRIVLQ